MTRAVAGVLFLALAHAVHAASVEVIVTDEGGAPLPDQQVRLVRPLPGDGRPASVQLLTAQGTRPVSTGLTGRARFEQVQPGTWSAIVTVPRGGAFVDEPPLLASAELTIRRDDEHATLPVVLRRGTRVRFRLLSTHGDELFGTVHARAAPAPLESVRVSTHEDAVRTLPAGRWELELQAPAGTAVAAADLDGAGGGGERVVIDLEGGGRERVLTWHLATSSTLEGTVDGPRPTEGVHLEVSLLEPAPGTAALMGLGSTFARGFRVTPDPRDGRFSTPLLEGTWRIVPAGARLRSAEPRFQVVTVTNGGTARADFHVELQDEAPPSLIVEVVDPDGRRLPQAFVRVEPLGGPADPPVMQGTTDDVRETLVVRGLEAGSYRILASREGFLPGERELEDFEQGTRPEWVRVALGRGGTIRVRARDGEEHPVAGVSVALRRAGERRPRLARTNATGWASFGGLAPGTHELIATGADLRPPSLVRFVASSAPGQRVVLEGDEEIDVELEVRPPALATMRLACDDRSPVGSTVELAWVRLEPHEDWVRTFLEVLDARDGGEASPDKALETAHPRAWVPVEDAGLVRSPALDGGAYRVALRPKGFDRWTWVPGTEDLTGAVTVTLVEGEVLDISRVDVPCAPRAALTVPGDVIDLATADIAVSARPAGSVAWSPAGVSLVADHAEIGPLPEGTAKLRAVLCAGSAVRGEHGGETCMRGDVPAGEPIVATAELELARGRITPWNWRPDPSESGAANDHQIGPDSR